jgi:hypothetical protein
LNAGALAGGFDERGAAMAPDGKHVAVTGRRGARQGVWLIDLDTGDMHRPAPGRHRVRRR